jgi:hypothetical protein
MTHRLICPHCRRSFRYREDYTTILGLAVVGLVLLAFALW